MKINFNNCRKQACYAYDRLVDVLNYSRDEDDKNIIVIDADDLYDVMNDLRMFIGSCAMTYEEGNEDFKDVFEEIYPEPKAMAILKTSEDDE